MKTNQLTIENTKYHYGIYSCETSEVPPIFLINGAFQDMHSWNYLVTILKDHFTIIVADLPCWGSADLLSSTHNFSLLSSAVNQILEEEKIDQVNLISTSYGSLIATTFAKEYIEKVANLMLCSPVLEISGGLTVLYPEFQKIISNRDGLLLCDFLCEIGLLNCVDGYAGKIDHFEKLMPRFKHKFSNLTGDELDKFLHNTDRILSYGTTDLSSIQGISTMVVTGEYDSFTTPEDCAQIARCFTSNRFETIPRADHMFLFERPMAFAKIILKNLGQSKNDAQKLRA